MKTNLKAILLSLFAFWMISCDRQELTILGNVSAVIDGEAYESNVISGTLVKTRRDEGSKNLTLSAFFNEKNESISISLSNYVDGGTGNDFQSGVYRHDSNELEAKIFYFKGSTMYENLVSSEIEITENNPDEKYVTGSFSAVLISPSGDTLNIEKGIFENVGY